MKYHQMSKLVSGISRGVVLIWISTGTMLPLCTETIEKKNEQFGSKGQRRISKALYVQCKRQCFFKGGGETQTFYETLPEHLLTNFRVSFNKHASTVPNYLRQKTNVKKLHSIFCVNTGNCHMKKVASLPHPVYTPLPNFQF
jgi:hypothetical protein